MTDPKRNKVEEEPSPGLHLSERYPDPAVEVLDTSFAKYRIFNAAVERLASGVRWSAGPVWFGGGRYLLWSDLPNNRIMLRSVFGCGHAAVTDHRLGERDGRLSVDVLSMSCSYCPPS